MTTEIEFVCAGCGASCLICDLETDVPLTHCTECANKRIRELEASAKRSFEAYTEIFDQKTALHKRIEELDAKLDRVRELPDQWIDKSFDPLFDVEDCADELYQALADD